MNLWTNHGTKLLGGGIALLGILAAATPEALAGVFGDRAPAVATAIGGLLTILRGFQNTSSQDKANLQGPKP